MPDMLVKLYDLPQNLCRDEQEKLEAEGFCVRRPIAPEKGKIVDWVLKNFSENWASECDVAFSQQPPACYIATYNNEIAGFACYDTTVPDYFGPTGVDPKFRGKGLGSVLLFKSMEGLKEKGYAYAIIGSAGPVDFYKKVVGAIEIENSVPGIYKGMLY